MRYLVAFVVLVGGAAAGLFVYRHMTAGVQVVLPRPGLQVTVSGSPLQSGGWTSSPSLDLRAVKAGVAADAGSGVAGYSYRLDTDPKGLPRAEVRTDTNSVALNGLTTGTYYFHVRAIDRVGNWGDTSTFPVHVDVTPPGLTHVSFSRFQLDPQFDHLTVSFAVTRPAPSVRVGVYRQSDGGLVRLYTLSGLQKGQQTAVSWDGKDGHGNAVPA